MIKLKDLINEIKIHDLTTANDGRIWFIAYRGNCFLVDEKTDFTKILPYFQDHPQLNRNRQNPFDEEDFDDFMVSIREFAPDVIVGYYDPKNKKLEVNDTNSIDAKTSLLLKKVVKQLKIKKMTMDVSTRAGDNEEIPVSIKNMRGGIPDIGYHGTTSKYLRNILKYGLKPNEGESNFKKANIFHYEEIFFAASLHASEFYAFNASHLYKGIPIVIEFTIPDKDLIKPDFDADSQSKIDDPDRFYKNMPRSNSLPKTNMDPMGVSREQGRWGYSGRIPASFIKWIYIFREHDKKWLKLKPSTVQKLLWSDYGFYKHGIEDI